ncbi:MAG: T9SS type A sorting domain-containing protein [Bacteroidetes bacterium]|nr:T9SS type A sorting domain-containing protein [Bacteroidota bacterium]
MKKLYFSLLLAFIFGSALHSQTCWTPNDPGIPAPILGCASLDVVNDNVIWAVFTHYSVADSLFGFPEDSICIVTVSTDGGTTWTNHQAPMGNPEFVANISAIDGQTAWICGLDFGGGGSRILKTTDGGATWVEQTSANWDPAASWVDFVYFWAAAKGVAMGDPKQGEFEIYTTGNGGQTWLPVDGANIDDPEPGEFGFNGSFDVVGNNVWFGTSTGRVFRSKDSGASWKAYSTGLPQVGSVDFRDENTGFASYFNYFTSAIKVTTDGGETWTDIASMPDDGNLRIEYGLRNVPGSTALVVTGAEESLVDGINKTWVSYDNGGNWTQIDEGHHVVWLDFYSPESGWGGQPTKPSGPSYLFKYTGSALVGLFDPKPLDAEISMFPNPTSGMIRLDVKTAPPGDYLLLVNDAQGRLVKKEFIENESNFQRHLDLSELAAGMYSVTVSGNEGSTTQKIFKQ